MHGILPRPRIPSPGQHRARSSIQKGQHPLALPTYLRVAPQKETSIVDRPNVPLINIYEFDANANTKPIAVSISDQSIFNNQVAFRRAELIPASNDGTDASTQGIKTLHFSVLKDNALPLNLSHEYQLAFLESQDFSTNQFVLKTGTILGQNTPDPDTLQLFGNVNQGDVLFSTPFTAGVFHNFALTLDFDQLTTQVFFSTGDDALVAVTDVLQNDVSGQGQFHFGVLKKPVGGVGDITKNGFQPDAIDEAVVFGGIFQEDSADGCISLSP